MKLFVTGGSGYVGRNLIRTLIKRGDEVNALVRSLDAGEMVEKLGATVVVGDITDFRALRQGMIGCDAVIHCAALVATWGDPLAFHRVNVTGTQKVIEACRSANIPRLIFISSVAVITDGNPKIHIDESTPYSPKPIGLYSLTKGLAERMVQTANSDRLQTTILRTYAIWGRDDSVWLPALVDAVQTGRWVWINGGHHLISTCHIDNMVAGIVLALNHDTGGNIYFVTDGAPVELRNFITNLLKTQGIPPPDRQIAGWVADWIARIGEFVVRRFQLDRDPPLTRTMVALMRHELTLNDQKAQDDLGYRPTITREAGMIDLARRKRGLIKD